MTISRFGFNGRGVALGLVVLMALSLAACVSVKESGNQPPAPPVTTSVMFDANYRNAEVYVNGEFRGTVPVSLHLPAGTHKVEIRLDGFESWQRELVVVAGDDTRVAATLTRE